MDYTNDTQRATKPELLAPAGNMDALMAALGAGADAVYLGLDVLNARSNAGNFTLETLAQACEYAHMHNARIYLTVNVVILPHEMQQALELIEDAWLRGIDAVIIQDLGLIEVLSETLPEITIHASTQMNIHSSESVRALARYGVKRITLARETSQREIETLVAVAHECGMEIETFVHGAICVCYSGQCFLSSLIGRRSANRGQCAQPCRLAYDLVDKYDEPKETLGHHLLSPKDMAGIENIDRYIAAGVASLKIEGRMKSPAYVAAVVSTYRAALDEGAVADPEAAYAKLAEAFSRGFTTAYFSNNRGNAMMSYTRPNNRGTAVGRIIGFDGAEALIQFDKPMHADDTIEIWTNRGRFTQPLGTFFVDDKSTTSCEEKTQALVTLEQRASVGDRVFRVRSSELSHEAQDAIEKAQGVVQNLEAHVIVKQGQPLEMTVIDEQGRTGVATGAVVEAARTKELSLDDTVAHIDRLGNTLYHFSSIDVDLDQGVGLGFSALHTIRRDALKDYERKRFFGGVERAVTRPDMPVFKRKKRNAQKGEQHIDVVAVTDTIGGAKAALNAGAAYAHVAAYNLANEEAVAGVLPVLPRVAHDDEIDTYLGIAERFGGAVCSTLGQLKACAYRGIPAQAHWSLNATNVYTVHALAEQGANFVWLSPELSGKQIAGIAQRSNVPVGIAVAGLAEVMVTEHCILMSMGPCAQNCATCERRSEPLALLDRKGYHFRVITDVTGRSHIYNSVPLDLTDALQEILDAGVSGIRLDLETALTSSVSHEVSVVRTALLDTLAGREVPKVDSSLTRGHFFRGVI